MKLQNLISVCQAQWIDSFSEELEEKDSAKRKSIFNGFVEGRSEDELMVDLYDSVDRKSKKSFNQISSTLYKDLLTHLLIHFREYPDLLMANFKRALHSEDEETFNRNESIIERILIDTENFESLTGFYYLMRDHHYAKITKPTLRDEYEAKLMDSLNKLQTHHSIEQHFFQHDIGRSKKSTTFTTEEMTKHLAFFASFFGKEFPERTRIRARNYWLRTKFCFQLERLDTDENNKVSEEFSDLIRKSPFLYFNHPEILEFSNISYRVYTGSARHTLEEQTRMFESFHKRFNAPWLLSIYPRIYQALITTQYNCYGQQSKYRFVDDDEPLADEIRTGIESLISLIRRVRDRASYDDQQNKLYGILTEGFCHISLAGEHLSEAIQIFEMMLVQEQQSQNAFGKHEAYRYLCTACFYNRSWDKMLEVEQKYRRFIKVNGFRDDPSRMLLEFQSMISKLMLHEIEMEPSEILKESKRIYTDSPGLYEEWVPYVLDHLKLTADEIA